MFKTFQGVTEDAKNTVYLRPETAQGIFVNFVNVQRTTRKKLPFGIGQIGKSFRNEITPGNFIFRIREFEQMELEFFCKPGTDLEWFNYWRSFCHEWLLSLGMKEENLRLRDHDPEELCFYSKATTDFEFLFPFGWGELWGVADRTDYDLTQHQNTSGKRPDLLRPGDERARISPMSSSPLWAWTGCVLAFLMRRLRRGGGGRGEGNDDVRVVLHLHPGTGPLQGRGAAPVQEAGRQGHARFTTELAKQLHGGLSTTPAPSASATAARTRLARPSASPWTSRP